MLLTCGDVIGRYVFNNSINGTTELTELALGIIIFCQIPVVTIASTHVVVDILDRLLPSIFLRLSGVVSHLIVGVGFYYLADRIWFMAERSMRRGVFTEFLQIPVAYFIQFISIMMYFSAAVLIIVALRKLIKKDL
jgi:TRAP-type C4-dicarboxylate transport system permease small subunit